jgi:hypothetical protein
MTVLQTRRQIKRRIDSLSEDRLRLAEDLIAYLEEQESIAATEELRNIPGFVEAFKRAKRDAAEGRVTPLEKIRWKK